uniref:Gem-associated protein 2 n=1 Tax=Phallusia mammillata TaxID=59560 RepID=A0A6F9DDP9_9ASCI|nr:gem-associated protein 2 [Phallusia mammillata]
MSDKASSTRWPTGENLAATQEDYTNIPGATPFFKLDSKDFSLENYTPSTGLPSNPQDYLRNVMIEARDCPNVVVAKSRPSKIKQNDLNLPEEEDIPGGNFAPTKEWCQMQVSNFFVARSEFSRHLAVLKSIKRQTKKRPKLPIYPLPAWDDELNWRLLSLGNKFTERNSDFSSSPVVKDENMETADEKHVSTTMADNKESCENMQASANIEEDRIVDLSQLKEGYPPLLRMLLRMDAKHVESNLEYHVRWLQTYGFSHQQGRWIYALLVCLEKPLFPTVLSTLRDLARQCAQLRTTYTSEDMEQLNGLNLIICIVGKYFDQSDLLDNT